MMIKLKLKIIVALLVTIVFSFTQSREAYFQEANRLYEAKKYHKAKLIYQELFEEDPSNYKIAYNLANTHYALAQRKNQPVEARQSHFAQAVFFFKQVLKQHKTHSPAYDNLKILWQENGDVTSLKKEILLRQLHLFNSFNAYLTSIIFLLILIVVARNMTRKKKYFRNALVLTFSYVFLMGVLLISQIDFNENEAVLKQMSEVKSNPSSSSETLFVLKEGNIVNLEEVNESEWSLIKKNQASGWVKKNSLLQF